MIKEEIHSLVEQAYDQALTTLKVHEKELHFLAEALIKYETLDKDEILAVIKVCMESVEVLNSFQGEDLPGRLELMRQEKIQIEERKKKKQEERVEQETKKREDREEEKKAAKEELRKMIAERKKAQTGPSATPILPTETVVPMNVSLSQEIERQDQELRRTLVDISNIKARKKTRRHNLRRYMREYDFLAGETPQTNQQTEAEAELLEKLQSLTSEERQMRCKKLQKVIPLAQQELKRDILLLALKEQHKNQVQQTIDKLKRKQEREQRQ